ncbi:CPBP family intramembrane glutamic endopeptidase [Lactiplantibacillus mudanjiangensis]|uniref:CAAX prenyl protease 2/Lysostaphin resistance protein A-like domain-containing protein n=1 Tax=Lactiplantibacillus mudanjiangensis TaxID=1296538 RepID=A0A660E398_9LACO|nr:type II CAAX endopeptidase family protein [Lactiplantibacillus mudanjiangensis]VDG26253.1 hypothetical protein [Lactobacillus johnsonii NCC 533] [Lactiplantibacillus mudanjiangensis]VDG27413.1 hypothetical protein [Lactobacillus johnsonii NCC 533] [Lactiplantibacillus mudanjiangensis]
MSRLKRILSRWRGGVMMVWLFFLDSLAAEPMFFLAWLKTTNLTLQIALTALSVLLTVGVIAIAWWYYRKWPPIRRFFKTPKHVKVWWFGGAALMVGQAWLPWGEMPHNQLVINRLLYWAPGMAIIVVVLGPMLEEFIFRGIFFRRLLPVVSRWQTGLVGVLISALIFGSLHGSLLIWRSWSYVLAGVILASTYLITADLRSSIVLHMLNNLISVLLFFI